MMNNIVTMSCDVMVGLSL